MINGIQWRTDNGAKWWEIPERYGPWQTCYSRVARWQQQGMWDAIERRLQADADERGELDWNDGAALGVGIGRKC